ncbi:MAG: hypothetical protein J7L15_03055 [Clostridiales bacterium]|nr:hypothetical protein [Clostridiales bacterium]
MKKKIPSGVMFFALRNQEVIDAIDIGKKQAAKEIFEEIEKMFSIPKNIKAFADGEEVAIRFITKKEWNKLKKQFLGDENN